MKEFAKENDNVKISIFTSYKDINYLLRFKRTNQIPFEIFNVTQGMVTALDTLDIPYMFVMKNLGEIERIFIPNRNSPEDSFFYFEQVASEFFDQ